ncbi:MAG TPA: GGDEF domain-containing protein, partial [Planctomycetota bacterium]|nr:GGDEF domain-containing protein [Planctomycetota bacterium]
ANAALGRLLAEQDAAQRRLSAITDVLLNAQRLVADQAPAEHFLEAIVTRLGYDRAFLVSLADDGRGLAVERVATAEGRADHAEGRTLPLADASGLPAREAAHLVAGRSSAEDSLLAVLGAREAMVSPLPAEGATARRFLVVERSRGFSELEPAIERMVQTTLSHCVALLLENHRLFRRAQDLAVTDALTGVANRRALVDALVAAAAAHAAGGAPFSVAMFDLDHFKRINDELGHLGGDRVLREVAEALKRTVRSVDLVGRFGGEEFCVLLADATLPEALAVAERARAAIAALGRATVSAGVAQHRDAEAVEPLLARADAALYRAKETGRNRIESAA